MNWRRIEIEFAPNSLKFNPIYNNNKNVKKKKVRRCNNDEIIQAPNNTPFEIIVREMMMMMSYTSSSRPKQFGFYIVSTNQKLLTQDDDDNCRPRRDDFLTPYLLQHDYNNGIIYYQCSRRTFAILVFVNAAGTSKLFRSITLPHDYFVEPNNTISTSSPPPVHDDWFIFEILTRLPVKTLLRFKTVCKRWGSLIQKDQNFIESHLRNRSQTSLRRLFIVTPVPKKAGTIKKECDDDHDEMMLFNNWPYKEIHVTADLNLFQHDKGGDNTRAATNVVVVDTVREVDSTEYEFISNSVNGLICLIESEFEYAVRICNISTGELSPWFESSLLSGEREINGISCVRMHYSHVKSNYKFGFDPSTNEHKLVCVWDVYSEDLRHRYLICEVLTVGRQGINGDTKWRRLEEVPDVPSDLSEDSIYVNGVIYWSSFRLNAGHWKSENRPVCVVAFDVGMEKFRRITVPDFILDQPRDDIGREFNPLNSPSYSTPYGEFVNLLEVSGRLAMLVRMSNCMFKMYIYEDDDYKLEEEINRTPIGKDGSFSSNNNGRWSEVSSITLPFHLGKKCGVRFCKFVGSNDEIIVTSTEGWNCNKLVGKKKCVSFYSYNWKKRSWREFDVSGIPSSLPHLCTDSYVTTILESLLPVNNDRALF